MRDLICRFESWLKQLDLFYFVFVVLILTYIAGLIAGLLSLALGITDIVWKTKTYDALEDQIFAFFTSITLAPLLETLIFQKVPTDLLYEKPYFRRKPYMLVLLPAIAFGLFHIAYSPSYAIFGLFVGVIFMRGYIIRYEEKKQPYTAIFLVHLIRNVIAVGYNIYVLYIK